MASSATRKVTLKSEDGEIFEISEAVALHSQTIKHMIEDNCVNDVVPVHNVSSKTLAKVIAYCSEHDKADSVEARKAWEADFFDVDKDTLFDLILAANYLDIKGLLDLACQAVANLITGKNLEEIRQTFNIKNDFTKKEEAEVRRENQWAFE